MSSLRQPPSGSNEAADGKHVAHTNFLREEETAHKFTNEACSTCDGAGSLPAYFICSRTCKQCHGTGKGEMVRLEKLLLEDTEPFLVKRVWKKVVSRILSKDISRTILDLRERQILMGGEYKVAFRMAQWLAWRVTLLCCGAFFFTLLIAMRILLLLRDTETSTVISMVGDGYKHFFEYLEFYQKLQEWGSLFSDSISVSLAILAAWRWAHWQSSRTATYLSFLFSYLPPFVFLLCLPYRHSVDFEGIQQQVCRDVVENASSVVLSGSMGLRWPKFKAEFTLLQELQEQYDISLPADFCQQAPAAWPDTVAALVEDKGFLEVNGSCPAAERLLESMTLSTAAGPQSVDVVTESAGSQPCPAACEMCTGVCTPYLLHLNALANVYGHESLRSQSFLDDASKGCLRCVASDADHRCAQRCSKVAETLTRQAVTGSLPKRSATCVDPNKMETLLALSKLAAQTSYFKFALGSIYALSSFSVLMPLTLSLVFGASKGANISRSIIPQSRLPGIIASSAASFTFLFVFQMGVLVQQMAGDFFTLTGILTLLVAIMAHMKPGLNNFEDEQETRIMNLRLDRLAKVSMLVTLSMFFVAALTSDILVATLVVLRDQGIEIGLDQIKTLGKSATFTIVEVVASMLGKSLISTVCFADSVLTLIYLFYEGEMTDPTNVKDVRSITLEDIQTLYMMPAKIAPG